MPDRPKNAFERASADLGDDSLLAEFWAFLRHNKKWWLLPLLVVLLLMGLLIYLSGSAIAPYIYTLF